MEDTTGMVSGPSRCLAHGHMCLLLVRCMLAIVLWVCSLEGERSELEGESVLRERKRLSAEYMGSKAIFFGLLSESR